MKVAVIGARGQLGSDICRLCPDRVNLIKINRDNVDITDRDRVWGLFGSIKPDVIINTAAFHKTDECEEKVEFSFKVNAIGVRNLVEVALDVKAKLVHISTDYVFDGNKIKERKPYVESDIPNPINIYGISKYAGELIVRNYCDDYLIVRVSSLFGLAGASGKGGNFVYTILRLARERDELKVVNDIYMTPTHTCDAAKIIWKLLNESWPSGIYHCSNEGICSWYDFAAEIVKIAGMDTPVLPVDHTFYPSKAKRPLWSPLSSEKGIKLRHWKEALADFISRL